MITPPKESKRLVQVVYKVYRGLVRVCRYAHYRDSIYCNTWTWHVIPFTTKRDSENIIDCKTRTRYVISKLCWLHVIIVYYWLQNAILCLGMWGQEWDIETSFNCPHSLWASVSGKVLRMVTPTWPRLYGCWLPRHVSSLCFVTPHLLYSLWSSEKNIFFYFITALLCFQVHQELFYLPVTYSDALPREGGGISSKTAVATARTAAATARTLSSKALAVLQFCQMRTLF